MPRISGGSEVGRNYASLSGDTSRARQSERESKRKAKLEAVGLGISGAETALGGVLNVARLVQTAREAALRREADERMQRRELQTRFPTVPEPALGGQAVPLPAFEARSGRIAAERNPMEQLMGEAILTMRAGQAEGAKGLGLSPPLERQAAEETLRGKPGFASQQAQQRQTILEMLKRRGMTGFGPETKAPRDVAARFGGLLAENAPLDQLAVAVQMAGGASQIPQPPEIPEQTLGPLSGLQFLWKHGLQSPQDVQAQREILTLIRALAEGQSQTPRALSPQALEFIERMRQQ
jgi:hypothetical protein